MSVTPDLTSETDASGAGRPVGSGVDTVSYAWRSDYPKAVEMLLTRQHRFGPGGARILSDRLAGDGVVMVWPSHNLIAVETRLAALLAGDETDHALAPAAQLGRGSEVAAEQVRELARGWDLPDAAEVRRADLAGELRFSNGRDGLAMLRRCAHLHAPRCKTVEWRGPGARPETVYWVGERSGVVKLRGYDKGVESKTAPVGERIRIERQYRPPKAKRMEAHVMAEQDLAALYTGPLASWTEGPRASAVEVLDALPGVLLERVQAEQLTMRKAERVLGTVLMLRHFGRESYGVQQAQRRLRELRQMGVGGLDEAGTGHEDEVTVPVAELLHQLREGFRA